MKKDLNIFGNDRPVLKFLILLVIISCASLLGRFIVCLIEKDNMNWSHYTFFLLLCGVMTISYFTGRLIAYNTRLFPNVQNRDRLLMWIFFLLAIILIIVTIVLV